MNVSFPLRDGHFAPLDFSLQDARRYKQLMDDLLQQSLEEETPYWTSQYRFLDATCWKPLKDKDRIRTYQARRSLLRRRTRSSKSSTASSSNSSAHAVLAIGTIEGSLEDVIYGMHHVATADMRATTNFLRDNALDGAVLHVFQNGTPDDPYRSLAVKWRVVETPGGSFVSNRDGCVLEYMGIDRDAKGHRYGFHITENFEHPTCPPFSSKCAVRSSVHTRIIFREVSSGRIGMWFKGDFGLGGRLPGSLARRTAADMALGIARSVACTEAKKLTALTLAVSPIFHQDIASFLPNLSAVCSICSTKPGYLSTKSMSWCKVCGEPVCSKCKSGKYLFSDDQKIRISCCKQCLVAAKRFPLDPTQALPLISSGEWLKLLLNQSRSGREGGFDESFGSSTRSNTEASMSLSTSTSTASISARSYDYNFENLVTPLASSSTDNGETPRGFDEQVALLESIDMESVIEEDEDDVPTLGELPWSSADDFEFNRKISLDDDDDDVAPHPFARSAFTPAVAKSEEQARIHQEADRMSLFAQMQRLHNQAESAFSMTQANAFSMSQACSSSGSGWDFMGHKVSTSSSSSSMRSTAAMSTSSHGSASISHASLS